MPTEVVRLGVVRPALASGAPIIGALTVGARIIVAMPAPTPVLIVAAAFAAMTNAVATPATAA